jgi:hypothetical protein
MRVHIKHQLHLLLTLLKAALHGRQAQQLLEVMLAAVQLQACARGLLARRQLQQLLRQQCAAAVIQVAWRANRQRLQAAHRATVAAAVTLQAAWRRWRQQRRHQEQQVAPVTFPLSPSRAGSNAGISSVSPAQTATLIPGQLHGNQENAASVLCMGKAVVAPQLRHDSRAQVSITAAHYAAAGMA